MNSPKRPVWWLIAAFIGGMLIMAGLAALLTNIQQRKNEAAEYPAIIPIADGELDPAVWGLNYPRQYDSFMRTQDDTFSTPYGGSVVYSKLERYPAMTRLWAGYAFSKDHDEERGHFYALTDQLETERINLVNQPGACANCHAAETPLLIAEMGWEAFNSTPYNELKANLQDRKSVV